MEALVDVAINAYLKPYETLLCLASLLRWSGERIGRIYLTVEPVPPHVQDPCSVAELGGLDARIIVAQPRFWLGLDGLQEELLQDKAYRFSIRYQYAWERCQADYLFLAHNDVHFLGDPLKPLVDAVNSAADVIAAGEVGQCSCCPAARPHLVEAAAVNDGIPCERSRYADFHLDYAGFIRLYEEMYRRREAVRPYVFNWGASMRANPRPLPECRVNEWCCLVDMRLGRPSTVPYGPARPLGAFCREGGNHTDTGCGWFRDVNQQGYRGKHVDLHALFHHIGGLSAQTDSECYARNEAYARTILLEQFPEVVAWAKQSVPSLFTEQP